MVGVILILVDFAAYTYGLVTGAYMVYPLIQITLPLGVLGIGLIIFGYRSTPTASVQTGVESSSSIRFCPRCRHKIANREAELCPNCKYDLKE